MSGPTAAGEAVIRRADDGTVTVVHADSVIRVSLDLLRAPGLEPWVLVDGVLQLDTAGQYRYRHLRDEPDQRTTIYARIT